MLYSHTAEKELASSLVCLYKALIPFTNFNQDLVTSQRLHLLTPPPWDEGANMNVEQLHSVHDSGIAAFTWGKRKKKDSVAERFMDLVTEKERELPPNAFWFWSISNTFFFLTLFEFQWSRKGGSLMKIGVREGPKRGKHTWKVIFDTQGREYERHKSANNVLLQRWGLFEICVYEFKRSP